MIADLVHHFLLPEVQKESVRKTIKAQQKEKLKYVHESIYHKLTHIPKAGKNLWFSKKDFF